MKLVEVVLIERGTLLKNTSWLMVEKILAMAANLMVMVVIAREVGVSSFGELSLALAVFTLFSPVSGLGLNAIVSRELLENPDKENKILATTVFYRLCAASVSFVGVYILILQGAVSGLSGVSDGLLVLFLLNLFSSAGVFEYWFQAKLKANVVAKFRLLVVYLISIFKVCAAVIFKDVNLILCIYGVEIAVVSIGFFYIYTKTNKELKVGHVDYKYGLALVKQSSWLVLSGLASIVYLKIDQIMLSDMRGLDDVGTYAVAARVSEVWYFFANAVVITMFPVLIRLKQTNCLLEYKSKIQKTSDFLFLMAIFLSIVVTVLSGIVVPIVFGEKYLDSAVILNIHIWASCFVFMRALVSKWLISERLLIFSLLSHGLGAAINVFLNLYLIPLYAGVGAAWATLISYFVASYLAFIFFNKTRYIAVVMTNSLLLVPSLGFRYWFLLSRGKQ